MLLKNALQILLEAKQMSNEITEEVSDTLQVLKNKNTSMTSFAAYASKVNESQQKKEDITKRVSYTRLVSTVCKNIIVLY